MHKNRFLKITTIFLISMLFMNPELFALGLFLDVLGLELFYLLLKIQIIAVTAYIINTLIFPALSLFNRLLTKVDPFYFIPSKEVAIKYPAILFHSAPGLVAFYWVFIISVW